MHNQARCLESGEGGDRLEEKLCLPRCRRVLCVSSTCTVSSDRSHDSSSLSPLQQQERLERTGSALLLRPAGGAIHSHAQGELGTS